MKRLMKNAVALITCMAIFLSTISSFSIIMPTSAATVAKTRKVPLMLVSAYEDNTEEKWTWDPVLSVLTLSGVDFDIDLKGTGFYAISGAKKDFTIVLTEGTENKIRVSSEDLTVQDTTGIYTQGKITIKGDGSLDIMAGKAVGSNNSFGIYAQGGLVIDGGNIKITGSETSSDYGSYGIFVGLAGSGNPEFIMNDGNLTIVSNAMNSYGRYAIFCTGNVTFNGGETKILMNDSPKKGTNIGISTSIGKFIINAGKIEITKDSYGVNSNKEAVMAPYVEKRFNDTLYTIYEKVPRNYPLEIAENQPSSNKLATEGWSWTAYNKTLVLDRIDINMIGNDTNSNARNYAIKVPSGTTIVLANDTLNKVYSNIIGTKNENYSGIFCDGDLTISGNGKLDVKSANTTLSQSSGIEVTGNLNINSGDIKTVGGTAKTSIGINVGKKMTINPATDDLKKNTIVNTIGGISIETDGQSFGILTNEFLHKGGRITATGGMADSLSYGLKSNQSPLIERSFLTIANFSGTSMAINKEPIADKMKTKEGESWLSKSVSYSPVNNVHEGNIVFDLTNNLNYPDKGISYTLTGKYSAVLVLSNATIEGGLIFPKSDMSDKPVNSPFTIEIQLMPGTENKVDYIKSSTYGGYYGASTSITSGGTLNVDYVSSYSTITFDDVTINTGFIESLDGTIYGQNSIFNVENNDNITGFKYNHFYQRQNINNGFGLKLVNCNTNILTNADSAVFDNSTYDYPITRLYIDGGTFNASCSEKVIKGIREKYFNATPLFINNVSILEGNYDQAVFRCGKQNKAKIDTTVLDESVDNFKDGWAWDYYTKTLTLRNINLDIDDAGYILRGIKVPENTIVFLSTGSKNNINIADNSANSSYGIYSDGPIYLMGKGELNINVGNTTESSYGIFTKEGILAIDCNALNINAKTKAINNKPFLRVGVNLAEGDYNQKIVKYNKQQKSITIDLTDQTNDIDMSNEGWVWTAKKKTIVLKGIDMNVSNQCGLVLPADSTIELKPGTVNSIAASGSEMYAIKCDGDITIKGSESKLNVESANSYGIYSNGKIILDGVAISATRKSGTGCLNNEPVLLNGTRLVSGSNILANVEYSTLIGTQIKNFTVNPPKNLEYAKPDKSVIFINSNNLKENVDYTIYYNDQKQKSWSKTAPNYTGKFNARIVLNENVNKKYYFANEQDCTIQYEIIKNSSPILSNTFTPNGSSYLEKPQTITIKSEFVCGGTYNIYANDELIYTKKIPVVTSEGNEFDTYIFTPGDERVYNFKIELNTVYYGFNSQTITKKIEYNGSQQTDVTLEGGKDISYGDEYKVTASGGSSTGNFVYSIINEKKSNNTDATPGSIATIDQNGNVKAVGIGSYQIKVYRNGDETYLDSPAQVSPVLKTEKRKISITGITATDRAYDKTTVVALSGGTVSGILESDASSVTVTIPTTGEITDKNASETSKPVSFSTENILSGEKKDYYVVECDNITVNITKRSVTIDGITVNNKIYDGTKSTTIKTDGKVSSTLPGESLSFTSGTIEFSTENVGDNIKVIAKDFAISGTDASNYVLESQPTIPDATITKKELTVSVEKISINCGQILPILVVNVTGFVTGQDTTINGFVKPVASVDGTYDFTDTALTSYNVSYTGGEATSNYQFNYQKTAEIEIIGVDVSSEDYSINKDITQWQNSNIIITPKNGYTMISKDKSQWLSTLEISENGEVETEFYLKKPDGTITRGQSITTKIDTVTPEGEVLIKENSFKKFINVITFGLFFKDSVDVSIGAKDENGSGVKSIEYQKVANESQYNQNGTWNQYTQLSITENEKFIIYAKITDNAGNVTIINSEGVVVYTDSTIQTESFSYKKLSNIDVVVTATLNDNTIKEVKLGDTTLTAEQCVIENEKITIKSGYLNTLQPESHTFTVSYKPLGEEFVKGDEPLKSSFTIDIERCTFDVKLVDFTAPKNLEYDSTAKSAQVTVKNGVIGVGSITVNYYSNDIKLQGNPINAGIYTVKIDVADGLNYSGENDVVVSNFEIKNASQSAPTTPVGVNPTTMANNDGKITGVTLEMEYKKKSSQQWISVSSSETELKNLANGEYEIRFKAKTNYNAGEIKTITLEKFTGNQMKKPEAIFDAKTRKLSNVVSGQKYKITGNNENWILITDTTIDLSSIVNSTLKIQVMMPGDNTLTTDSEIQEIQVVKAEKPTLQKTDETIKNKKDGTITGLNNTMEWKTETGDWQAVKENSLSNLIPGKYFVRVSAQGNTIESDFVEIEILSGRQLTVTIPENTQGYTVSTEDSKQKAYGDNFTFKVEVKSGYNTSEMVVKAGKENLKANEDGTYTTVITENTEITVTGVTDTTKPTGEIALSENKWAEFLNTITFGLFFKETQTINVTAEDTNGSGVKTVEYLLSETAFETVESVTGQWNKLTLNENKASFDISPESKQIVYVKITDNAGNATIINSNGIVLDSQAPTISGVTNETKHYGDTTFKVTDTNLLKVTVDNNEVKLNEGAYTITADNAEHTIVATDSAGNTTSYKIGVYKIYTLIFKADGNEVAQKKVNHGNDLTDIPEIPAKTGYDQKAPVWNVTNFTNIQEDKTIDAVYTINSYTVTPITGDGFEIKPIDKTTVNHGDNFTFKVEVKSGYNTSEMVVKAGKENLKANEDGTYTTVITENTEITVTGVTDTTKPTGEIALSENKWAEFLNTITFGLFFKETQTINVTAEDTNGSGVKTVEYLLSETAFETVESVTGQWNKLTLNENKASFDISPESKQIVYVKITDNAGNVTIINSNGIVVYTDSTLISGKTEFNNDIQQDIIININLNGNTVNKIYNGSIELEKDVDYIVTDETIIIKKEYIEKMLEEDSLTLTLSFNPMDENFQGEENVPATAEFIIIKHIHTWDEGVVTIPAKIHEEGLMTYTCTACEFTRTEIIEKVPVNERIIISENYNISIKGQFSNQAKITVEQIVGQESYNDILRLINTDVNEIINAYDVNITDGDYTGRLSISFKIGEKYNGKTITVYHQKKNNEIEILHGVCENGLVTINVDELSPFVLTVEKSTEIPDTRDNSQNPWMAMLFISCSITFVFAGVMKKRAISKR